MNCAEFRGLLGELMLIPGLSGHEDRVRRTTLVFDCETRMRLC